MKALIACLVPLVLQGSLATQQILRLHKGEKPLLELSTWSDAKIANNTEPCGKYFLYQMRRDQDVVTVKVSLTEKEERAATTDLIEAEIGRFEIRIDNMKRVPTAEWVFQEKESVKEWWNARQILIRISSQDYDAAHCLVSVRPS